MRLMVRNRATIFEVASNMQERDFEEISAVVDADSRERLAEILAVKWEAHPGTFVLGTDEGYPVSVMTAFESRPGVCNMGLFSTNDVRKIGKSLTKFSTHGIIPMLSNIGCHRFEAQSIEGYDEIHKWLAFLGMKKEGLMRKFGRGEENFETWAYVRPDGAYGFKWVAPGRIEPKMETE